MARGREQLVEAETGASAQFTAALGAKALEPSITEGPRTLIVGFDGHVGDEAVGDYISGLYDRELLTAEEEVRLAREIEAGLVAERVLGLVSEKTREQTEQEIVDSEHPDALEYLQKIADRPELKSWQGRRKLRRVIREGKAAKERFILCNLRLVVAKAKRYVGQSDLGLDELIQEGNDGLIIGVEKFDFTKGYKFSTYGSWWIRQSITRAIDEIGYTVRKPADKSQIVRKMQRARRDFAAEHGEEPTVDELAAGMEVPREAILLWMGWEMGVSSLDVAVGGKKQNSVSDIMDVGEPTPEEIVLAQLDHDNLHTLLHRLSLEPHGAQMADVIRWRYGLVDGQTYSITQTASRVGLTRDKAGLFERRGLERLRVLAAAMGEAAFAA